MGKGDNGVFDLERHWVFYAQYHSNPVNVLIHMLFVWPNFFTSLLIFHFIPLHIHLPLASHITGHEDGFDLNFAFFYTIIHAIFYVILDKKAGSLAALLCFLCFFGSHYVAQQLGFSLAWKVVLAAQSFCFSGQVIGHKHFEKRAPALMDNFFLSFLMAPFFGLIEVLDKFFGYEPYPGFHKSVKEKIKIEQDLKARKSI